MFSAHALREKRGIPIRHAHTDVTTFTYFSQNWSIGCLLALYGSTKHPAQLCGGFGQFFFLLSVLVSLKKKKKKKALLGLIKHVGVFLALCGVCACALMQVLLLPIGRGFTGQCLDIGAWDLASAIGGRVQEAVVTFEPREEALGAWQEVKGEAMSVNEALYAGAMEGTVRLDGS